MGPKQQDKPSKKAVKDKQVGKEASQCRWLSTIERECSKAWDNNSTNTNLDAL